METSKETAPGGTTPRRVIKRYSNRKLYDTKDSRYVTLLQIADMAFQQGRNAPHGAGAHLCLCFECTEL